MTTLPAWKISTLGEIATVIRGVTYKKPDARGEPAEGYIPILRATNINGSLNFEDLVYVPARYVRSEQMLMKGDIVIAASSGSKNVVGKAAQLTESWEGSFGAFCFVLRPGPGVHPAYVLHFLNTQGYRSRISELSAGVNINNIRRQHLEDMPIPLASPQEQQLIVEELAKHFTRLDAAIEGFDTARRKAEALRQTLLAQAFSGQLRTSPHD